MQNKSVKDLLSKRVAQLLSVKSIVTVLLTGVFAYMAVDGKITSEFMQIYTMIISFYFISQNKTGATPDAKEE